MKSEEYKQGVSRHIAMFFVTRRKETSKLN